MRDFSGRSACAPSACAAGLLTGKVGPERKFEPGDHRATHKFFTVENRQRVQGALEKIRLIAEKHNASFAQVVINWTFSEPGNSFIPVHAS